MTRCDKCGSDTHKAWDCSKPYNGWREAKPETVSEIAIPVIEESHSDLSGPLPTRDDFPFVGPSQKAEIARREELKKQKAKVEKREEVALPRAPKEAKQETLI